METEVRKVDSRRGDSQICSEWLAENIKGIDQSLKEILLLIGHDGEFRVENVEQNHPKQAELIAHIKEISSRHHKLADFYQKLTGTVTGYNQLNNEMEKGEITGSDPELHIASLTPVSKLKMPNFEEESVFSDLSPSFGGGTSDIAPNEDTESSALSSDSDSESCNSSPDDISCHLPYEKMGQTEIAKILGVGGVFGGAEEAPTYPAIEEKYEVLLKQIFNYEKELKASEEKCLCADEEIAKLKSDRQENEALMIQIGSLEVELVSAKERIRTYEHGLEKENGRSMKLQEQIFDLEANFKLEKMRVQDLEENVTKLKAELENRALEIQRMNVELEDASENYAMEKRQLEFSISELSERVSFLKAREKEMQIECRSLAVTIKEYETEKIEMEKTEATKRMIRRECIDAGQTLPAKFDQLKVMIYELKAKHDILKVEKDEASANAQTLSSKLSNSEEQMKHLEQNLVELQSENKQLIAGADQSNKLTHELQSKIDTLEKEVTRQAAMIFDTAEGKREAIRQLCFSLDHFKSSYNELRRVYGLIK